MRRTIGRHSLTYRRVLRQLYPDQSLVPASILTDVRDIPRFLDLVVTPPGGAPINVTKNGFRSFMSDYANGTGQTTIVSGVLGGEVQITDRLRADLGGRVEYDDYVQQSENKAAFDLDNNPATPYDNITFGNGSFRHFTKSITDWSASVGLNYRLSDAISLYSTAARGTRCRLWTNSCRRRRRQGGPVRIP